MRNRIALIVTPESNNKADNSLYKRDSVQSLSNWKASTNNPLSIKADLVGPRGTWFHSGPGSRHTSLNKTLQDFFFV